MKTLKHFDGGSISALIRRNRSCGLPACGPHLDHRARGGFTIVELLVVIAVLALMGCLLVPGLARTKPNTQAFQCLNNLKQLTAAWKMYASDNSDGLVAAENTFAGPSRPNWFDGVLDYSGSSSNWNTNQDMVRSPLWPYTGKTPAAFRCPADLSAVTVNGVVMPRVRSLSMSQTFGKGTWLDKTYNPNQFVWRTYSKGADIVLPARTFVLLDENADSINDAAFANPCTGAQPADPPSAAQIIDYPAAYHSGAANFSFADGHLETHKWIGSKIKPPATYKTKLTINVPADDSWLDVQWLAQNTTVRR